MARQLDKHEKDELAAMVQRTSVVATINALAEYAKMIAGESEPSPFKRAWVKSALILDDCSKRLINQGD